MMVVVYGIKNCNSMKKAFDYLQAQLVQFEFHDYKKQGLPDALLDHMLAEVPFERLINKQGTTWRKLLLEQQQQLSVSTAKQMLPQHTSLIKRPLIHANGTWLVGLDDLLQHDFSA